MGVIQSRYLRACSNPVTESTMERMHRCEAMVQDSTCRACILGGKAYWVLVEMQHHTCHEGFILQCCGTAQMAEGSVPPMGWTSQWCMGRPPRQHHRKLAAGEPLRVPAWGGGENTLRFTEVR